MKNETKQNLGTIRIDKRIAGCIFKEIAEGIEKGIDIEVSKGFTDEVKKKFWWICGRQ